MLTCKAKCQFAKRDACLQFENYMFVNEMPICKREPSSDQKQCSYRITINELTAKKRSRHSNSVFFNISYSNFSNVPITISIGYQPLRP